jgi:hypothetical protein
MQPDHLADQGATARTDDSGIAADRERLGEPACDRVERRGVGAGEGGRAWPKSVRVSTSPALTMPTPISVPRITASSKASPGAFTASAKTMAAV